MIIVACLFSGCTNKGIDLLEHNAWKTMESGKWKVRKSESGERMEEKITITYLAVDVTDTLTEKEKLEILDYYEKCHNGIINDEGNWIGEKDVKRENI